MNHPDENRSKEAANPSNEPSNTDSPNEERLLQVVQQYMRELEAGRQPNRQEWNDRYPELQPTLNECLEGLVFMRDAGAAAKSNDFPPTFLGAGLLPGMPLGDFEIVREIGRGGMGIVYEAIQLSLGRNVALKTLPFATSFDPKYLQRFRQEAQAAAQLHHANIVPVYAVGCERGVNFYAMQLIDGQSLDYIIRQLCNSTSAKVTELSSSSEPSGSSPDVQSHQAAVDLFSNMPTTDLFEPIAISSSSFNNNFSPTHLRDNDIEQIMRLSADLSTDRNKIQVYRTIATLMAQAAEALEYAHQQGIIHRDIKPANLLIDMKHNLWITDFGLAHLHTEQNLTHTGDVLGTIRYASPEQVSGQRVMLDHRTDLYSLGATFYELITLRPVFTATDRHVLLQQILNHDPVAPRSIDRSIPVEFETILLKLLSKRPEERYGSAQEVADDLHRFLRNDPILAKPPTLVERMRKWGRRHPSYVVALVVVMLAVMTVSGISNYLVAQSNLRVNEAWKAERIRAEQAELNLQQARKAVDYMIQVSENELSGKIPFHPVQRRIMETAIMYYQVFIDYYRENPSKEAELQAVKQRLKKVLDDMLVIEGAGQMILLGEKDVQADLNLNWAERQRFDTIAHKYSEQRNDMLQGYQDLSTNERRERFLKLARESEMVTQSILSEQQLQRLKQINIQLQGITAFNQPEIADQLKLTQSQRELMRQIEIETFILLQMNESTGSHGKMSPHKEKRRILNLSMEKSLEALTPEQLTIWKKIVGAPFSGHLSSPLPGILMEP